MTLDEYIFQQLILFEKENDFSEHNRELTDNVVKNKNELIKLLDNNQMTAFKNYCMALNQYESAEKANYFTEGFIRGFNTRNS